MRINIVGETAIAVHDGEEDIIGAFVLSEKVARQVMELLISPRVNTIDKEYLIDFVCKEFDVTRTDLMRSTRRREVVMARYVVFYILYKTSGHMSLSTVGAVFNKDHATVLHGLKVIELILETRDKLYFTSVRKVLSAFLPNYRKNMLKDINRIKTLKNI